MKPKTKVTIVILASLIPAIATWADSIGRRNTS